MLSHPTLVVKSPQSKANKLPSLFYYMWIIPTLLFNISLRLQNPQNYHICSHPYTTKSHIKNIFETF